MYAYACTLTTETFSKTCEYYENLKTFQTDLVVYINHFGNLEEDFNIRFADLDNMHVAELLVTQFDIKIDNKG